MITHPRGFSIEAPGTRSVAWVAKENKMILELDCLCPSIGLIFSKGNIGLLRRVDSASKQGKGTQNEFIMNFQYYPQRALFWANADSRAGRCAVFFIKNSMKSSQMAISGRVNAQALPLASSKARFIDFVPPNR